MKRVAILLPEDVYRKLRILALGHRLGVRQYLIGLVLRAWVADVNDPVVLPTNDGA